MRGQNPGDCERASLLPKELKAAEPSLQLHYEAFKTEVTRKAMKVLQETLPEKLKQYTDAMPVASGSVRCTDFPFDDQVYKVPALCSSEEVCSEPKRVKRSQPEASAEPEWVYTSRLMSSKKVNEKVDQMKEEAIELLEIVAAVKLWVQLNIPKIEDGNNFGVAIQEDVIHELSRVEEAAFNLRDSTSKYYVQRAKIATKILKYPNVEDYRITLRELDEKQWFQLRITHMDTRNNYAIIYDMLYKNWHKVVRPRNTDGSMMVY